MKVLQVMAGAEFGGAEAFFTRMVIALHRAGEEERAVIRAKHRRANALRQAGLAPVEAPFGNLFDFRTPMTLRGQTMTLRGQTMTLTRIGADFLFHTGFSYDRSRDNVGVAISLEPRFGPRTPYSSQMGSLLGLDQR